MRLLAINQEGSNFLFRALAISIKSIIKQKRSHVLISCFETTNSIIRTNINISYPTTCLASFQNRCRMETRFLLTKRRYQARIGECSPS